MFNFDRWREILDTLWRSKLRSLLTAFSVAWGIFMLVFLLGMGNGLQNGVQQEFADDATNSVWMFSGRTSMPYDGMPIGRRIIFANRDVDAIDHLPGVDKTTGRFFIGNNRGQNPVQLRFGDKVAPYDVRSVHPDHLYLEKTIIVAGRFINDVDLVEEPTRDHDRVLEVEVVGVHRAHVVRRDLVADARQHRGGAAAASDEEPTGDLVDAREPVDRRDVAVGEHDATADRHAVVRNRCPAGEHPHRVGGVVGELLLHAVLEPVAHAEQEHQHEDPPCDGERGEERAQLAAPQRVEDLAPAIEVEHGLRSHEDPTLARGVDARQIVGR